MIPFWLGFAGVAASRAPLFCGNGGQRLQRAPFQRAPMETFTLWITPAFTFCPLQSLLGERSKNVARGFAERGEVHGEERDHARGLS